MGISNLSFSATNINVGLDADKIATPSKGSMYIATDTEILYRCYADGSWTSDELTEVKIDAVKPDIAKMRSGSYTGDYSVNRAIAHGLGVTPKLVIAIENEDQVDFILHGVVYAISEGYGIVTTSVTAADSTNFYVGTGVNQVTANWDGHVYRWVVFV